MCSLIAIEATYSLVQHDELEPWLRVGNKTGMAVRQRVVAWADLPEEVRYWDGR